MLIHPNLIGWTANPLILVNGCLGAARSQRKEIECHIEIALAVFHSGGILLVKIAAVVVSRLLAWLHRDNGRCIEGFFGFKRVMSLLVLLLRPL